jgi:uncharacterized protein (DUF433 family)
VKGTRIRAIVLASALRPAPDEGYLPTPESVAADYNLPVEAVREAARYCEANPRELQADKRWEDLMDEACGYSHPKFQTDPPRYRRTPTSEEIRKIDQQVLQEFGPV